jgi:hypothetical protein
MPLKGPSRALAVALSCGCLTLGCGNHDSAPRPLEPPQAAALQRSLDWLGAHPPDPRRDPLGELVLDAMTWHVFAALHPAAEERERAARVLGERLSALPEPGPPAMVPLSYWAPALALARRYGVRLDRRRRVVAGWDADALLAPAQPHTRLWIQQFLHDAGLGPEPEIRDCLCYAGRGSEGYPGAATVADAYRLFHELVPLGDFGTRAPTRPDAVRRTRAAKLVAELIPLARRAGDTDAVAEALVASALLGGSGRPEHRAALEWMLSRQHEDGTYRMRDEATRAPAERYRHVVLTASWALLAPPAPGVSSSWTPSSFIICSATSETRQYDAK